MHSANDRYSLVFNGELYNFTDIRSTLAAHGVRFYSSGDTEVVLQAIVFWGVGALERFNGMFALAFYDSLEQRLLLARDHIGMKPLYYTINRRSVVFASQYDQIVHHPAGKACGISAASVAMYLQLGYIPAPHALLEGTHMLEPGCWTLFQHTGSAAPGRYYRLPAPSEPGIPNIGERLGTVLDNAVERHLQADVPVGCLLSGGVDSPLIASSVQSGLRRGGVRAFTIGSEEPWLDESAEASRYSRDLDLELISYQMREQDALGLLEDVLSAACEPIADEGIFPSLLVSRLAAEHVKVVLGGDGGDELFWGYVDRHREVLAEHSAFPAGSLLKSYCRNLARFPKEELNACFPDLRDCSETHGLVDLADASPPESIRRWDMQIYLPYILLNTDRASMFHSLEVRLPFLDREMIDVAFRFGWRDCVEPEARTGKGPLRDLLQKRCRRPLDQKRGFSAPMDKWVRGPLRTILSDSLSGLSELGGLAVDSDTLGQLRATHQNGKPKRGLAIWRIFLLREWMRRHAN
jgi:asparagine synthase (glutamine-hydrolysing)